MPEVSVSSTMGGMLSTLEELSLLRPSLVLGRLDPLKVKHNSRFITKKKSPYKLSDFISVTTDFLGGLTGRVGGGSAAAGLALPGVVAPVSIHKFKKKSYKEIKVNVKTNLVGADILPASTPGNLSDITDINTLVADDNSSLEQSLPQGGCLDPVCRV